MNKAARNRLRDDLEAAVENACAAGNVISEAWCQKSNADALGDLVMNDCVTAQPLPDAVTGRLREETHKLPAATIEPDPATREVHESHLTYKAKFAAWPEQSQRPHHTRIRKARRDDGPDGGRDRRRERHVRSHPAWIRLALVLVMAGNVLLRYGVAAGSVWARPETPRRSCR